MLKWFGVSLNALIFGVCVVAPSIATGLYFYLIASDQYHSRVAFIVRSLDSSPVTNVLGMLSETSSGGAEDALLLYDFIQSQKLVEALDQDGVFTQTYNDERADPLFTLGRDQPIEWKTFYWNMLTRVSFNNTSRVVEVDTYAFTPEAATELARRVAAEAERLVNQISEDARRDAVSYAEDNVKQAEERLRDVRLRIVEFRAAIGSIDPTLDAKSLLEQVATVDQAISAEKANLQNLRQAGLSDNSPSIRLVLQRIRSYETQLAALRTRLGESGATKDVSAFEELTVEREFAENLYTNSLTALTQAQGEARRSQRYLATHIQPTLAESSIYPSRFVITLGVFLSLFMLWAIVRMIIASTTSRI